MERGIRGTLVGIIPALVVYRKAIHPLGSLLSTLKNKRQSLMEDGGHELW
jgi:hypothetical protein